MAAEIARWETELWSCLSSGDGKHCPFYDHCQARWRGDWCPDDNRERVELLLDKEQCSPSDYDFIECGGCGGILKMVEMVSQQYLEKGEVHSPPVPTELVMLADDESPIEVRLVPLQCCHGAVWHLKDGWVVQLKEDDTPTARRFALFHEAFHILAHRNTSPVFKKRGSDKGSFNELLADHFAICVLMPQEWVTEKWSEAKDLDQMAETFDVPKAVTCIRLRRLGLV